MVHLYSYKQINVNSVFCNQFKVLDDGFCYGHEQVDTETTFQTCNISADIIRGSDTDTLIIMLGKMDPLKGSPKTWLDFRSRNSRRYIQVCKIYESRLESYYLDFTLVAIIIHLFFKEIKKLKTNDRYQIVLSELESFQQLCLHFPYYGRICLPLYGLHNINTVTDVRYERFLKYNIIH